jgi:predicted DNA-binding transcriptional regulator AlpA
MLAAFYSMADMRRRCGTCGVPASRAKVYRLISAGRLPRAVPGINAWNRAEVDDALAALVAAPGPCSGSTLPRERMIP